MDYRADRTYQQGEGANSHQNALPAKRLQSDKPKPQRGAQNGMETEDLQGEGQAELILNKEKHSTLLLSISFEDQ
jgi:hypothetical protein